MLIHYRCGRCGATLAAKDDYEGHTLPCALCRHQNKVPHVERGVTQAELRAVAEEAARREATATIAQRSERDARRLARVEAQKSSGRPKAIGAGVIFLGTIPCFLACVALGTPDRFGFSFPSLALAVAFGVVAMIIGLSIRQSAAIAEKDEFRRLVPEITDRLRQEQWRQWEAQRGFASPEGHPLRALG